MGDVYECLVVINEISEAATMVLTSYDLGRFKLLEAKVKMEMSTHLEEGLGEEMVKGVIYSLEESISYSKNIWDLKTLREGYYLVSLC